jgi:hypothetical protein
MQRVDNLKLKLGHAIWIQRGEMEGTTEIKLEKLNWKHKIPIPSLLYDECYACYHSQGGFVWCCLVLWHVTHLTCQICPVSALSTAPPSNPLGKAPVASLQFLALSIN